MKSIQYTLLICSLGALNALDKKTAEGFQKRLAGEIERLVAPAGEDIGVVAFDPTRVSFAALDQLLTEIKNSIVAVQSVNLRAHLKKLDAAIKLVKELYQKAWSADQLGRYDALAAEWQELRTLLQNARRDGDDTGARAIELLMLVFKQLNSLQEGLHTYYSESEKKLLARKKKLAEEKKVVISVPESPHQEPNILQRGIQLVGGGFFHDKNAELAYKTLMAELPKAAEKVFVTSKIPVGARHFDVWNKQVGDLVYFVQNKGLGETKGYLDFVKDEGDLLKYMYAQKRRNFTEASARLLMQHIETIAKKRKELIARIKNVRDDWLSSRYNRYGAELIDLTLAMYQYGAEQLRQEILDQIKKQQSPQKEISWKTKLKNFFSW